MIDWLVKAVFYIITTIATLIISPFISALSVLFPNLGTAFTYIINYLNSALSYMGIFIDVALIPRAALLFLIDYIAIKYSIYLIKVVFNFSINIYNKLKP